MTQSDMERILIYLGQGKVTDMTQSDRERILI